MDLMNSIMIAASGLRAQSGRMRVISENIANANSTGQTPGSEPYRRRIPTFESTFDRELNAHKIKLGSVNLDKSDFVKRHIPGHPAADDKGYVMTPNVNSLVEMMDMREAQRSYEANLNVIRSSRTMSMRTLDILRA